MCFYHHRGLTHCLIYVFVEMTVSVVADTFSPFNTVLCSGRCANNTAQSQTSLNTIEPLFTLNKIINLEIKLRLLQTTLGFLLVMSLRNLSVKTLLRTA